MSDFLINVSITLGRRNLISDLSDKFLDNVGMSNLERWGLRPLSERSCNEGSKYGD